MQSTGIENPEAFTVSFGGNQNTQKHGAERVPPGAAMAKKESANTAADQRVGKYLTFLLGREEYAIAVLKVREIMGIQDITAVPQTPAYVKGVINLRGKVIPVVDLRLKFCLPEMEYTQRTCIIVVQVLGWSCDANRNRGGRSFRGAEPVRRRHRRHARLWGGRGYGNILSSGHGKGER